MLPVIDSQDPLTVKFIRMKHQLGRKIGRQVHLNRNTMCQNLVRGQVGVKWHNKQLHLKRYVLEYGVCNKFKHAKARPELGNSLVRVNATLLPWQNISINPLGHIRVIINGVNSTKVYPLIVSDINTGVICFEILNRLEAKDVHLEVSCNTIYWGTEKISTRISSELSGECLTICLTLNIEINAREKCKVGFQDQLGPFKICLGLCWRQCCAWGQT